MHRSPAFLVNALLVAALAFAAPAEATELRPETNAAFDKYVQLTEARMAAEIDGRSPFLWIDRQLDAQRRDFDARLHKGEIVVSRVQTRDGGKSVNVPDGLSHHWVGTVFIPGASVDRIAALMQDYDRYPAMYKPNVRKARVIAHDGDRFQAYLQLFMKKVVSVVLNTEFDVRYMRVAPQRMQVRSITTRIAEVDEPDTPREHEKPVGKDSGFLWRFNNYWTLEQREAGTYVQCESISLSRTIPTGLGWIVGPFVKSIPRDSLEFTLGRMRTAAQAPPR